MNESLRNKFNKLVKIENILIIALSLMFGYLASNGSDWILAFPVSSAIFYILLYVLLLLPTKIIRSYYLELLFSAVEKYLLIATFLSITFVALINLFQSGSIVLYLVIAWCLAYVLSIFMIGRSTKKIFAFLPIIMTVVLILLYVYLAFKNVMV